MAPKRTKEEDDFDANLFRSLENSKRFSKHFKGVNLAHEYHLDPSILTLNLSIISSWLQTVGLYDLLVSSNHVYPDLVAYFYVNLVEDDELHALSYVKGRTINLNVPLVSHALGVSADGVDNLLNFEPIEALRVVLDDPSFDNVSYQIKVSDLDAPTRVLHLLITHSLMPRSGSHADIFSTDLGLLYFIKSGTPVSFPTIFLNHLLRKSKYSPYPVYLSKIFKSLRIPIQRERCLPKHPQSSLSDDTLRRCKIHLGETGWFRTHPSPPVRIRVPIAPAPLSPAHPASHAEPSTSHSHSFETNVLARLDILSETQNTILNRLEGLAVSQSSIMEEQRRLYGRFDDVLAQHDYTQERIDNVQQHMQDWMSAMDARWSRQFPPPSPARSDQPMDGSDDES